MVVVKGKVPAIPRLGIKPYSWATECLRGDVRAGNATSYPEPIGLGAMFSEDLLFKLARATGLEVRAKNNNYTQHNSYGAFKGLSCFSPVINIMRDSRWGRNEETYGEDPYLSGVYAAGFVRGLQGDNSRYLLTNAGCKHFDAYGGPETIPVSRFSFDAQVSMRDWRTTFLPAFRSCVTAGTESLMCSYNSINGKPACASKELLTDILRIEWGFKGYVISDANAVINIKTEHHYTNTSVDTVAACLNSGCNVELYGGQKSAEFFAMVDAVKEGKVTEDRVREMMKPMWLTRMRLGEFDPPQLNPYKTLNLSVIQSDEHRQLSLELALKSFVLLKNVNGALPLPNKIYDNIAVVGPLANNPYSQFGDYTPTIDLHYTTTPLEFSTIAKITQYAPGCIGDNRCLSYDKSEIVNAVKNADIVLVCLGLGNEVEDEGNDRANISLPGYQFQLHQDAVFHSPPNAKVILILFNAGPLDIRWAASEDKIVGIVEAFYPAQVTGEALKLALVENDENISPFGRLPFTWPMSTDQVC
ncbi:uncharacterized protein LOC126811077 [Patella vulgata]|uniref:uncharacterized protein LOC126811077 n=1 Tax=Patella vulgata TaxID=6465 RepID=UPI0024A83B60|nr:uncharacterized protein LOC126811077 [Patella vulgata]